MTYYEELGVRPDATAEEIRLAYRNLARLLHPDQQTDAALKRLAELQMKRLNSVHAVLADPAARRQYDAGLGQEARRPVSAHRGMARSLGFLAAGASLASLLWLLAGVPAQQSAARVAAAPDPATGVPPAATPIASMERKLARLSTELRDARRQLEAARSVTPAMSEAAAAPPPVEPVTPPLERVNEIVPPAPIMLQSVDSPAAPKPGFTGTWVYVPPRFSARREQVYAADYVEAVIVEEGGALRGRFRARYQVPDRPISSEVSFRFEGKAGGEPLSLSWIGAGGSRGDLNLRLLSRDTLELNWIALELGSQMGLASGTSVLTRRREP
jgi:hypothetical protein